MIKRSELCIHKIFAEVSLKYPEKIALQMKKDSDWLRFSYKETEGLSKKIGVFLINEGFKRNDFIALILENRLEWPIIYLGIMYAGLCCVPLDPELNPEELESLINDCLCSVVFISNDILFKKLSLKAREGIKKIIVLDLDKEGDNLVDFSQIKYITADNIKWPEVEPTDIASLIYTSGTTAQPKGVMLSHYNLCSNFKSIEKLNLIFSSDNILSILPLYHTYAFMVTLLVPLFSGATITYCKSLKPEDIMQVVNEAKISILAGVPQLFSLMHKAIFKKVERIPFLLRPIVLRHIKIKLRKTFGDHFRLMVCGGARLEPEVGSYLSRFFKFIEGYGLTETSPVVTLNPVQRPKFGSVGRGIPDVEIKIFNPDASGVGEVLIKGPNVMQGYFKQPALTQKILRDGWLHTGDLGYLDKEGYLYLTGRKNDTIVLSSGKNIYPEELESHYLKSPYVKEVCILGKKEEKFGREIESLYAVVVPDFEYFRKKNEVNIKGRIHDELNILSKNLPSYKHIMGFTITKEELPRTRLKKVIRYKVSQKYLKEISVEELKKVAISDEDGRILETEVAGKIIDYLSRELKKPIYLDSHLEIDLGIDSLSRVELVLGLEGLLKIKIPDEFVYKISNVRDLIIEIQKIISGTTSAITEATEEKKPWSQILSQEPNTFVLSKIRIASGFLDKVITFIFKIIFLFILRAVWFLRVKGSNNLLRFGPYIICSNHASYLDGFVIFASLPFRSAVNIFFIGHAKIFEHPLISWAVKVARLISIDPAEHLIEAMQASSFVLKNKKIICIFPEGGRSSSEEIREFKKGVGVLAKELNIPIIPINILGSHHSWPVTSKFPRPYPLKIVFGKPLYWQQLGQDYADIVKGLRESIIKLKNLDK